MEGISIGNYETHSKLEATESLYVIKEYGIQAWYDLSAITDYPMAQEVLNRILKTLIRIEQYEDCRFIEELIPLFAEKKP
jgi:hypothetical protein